MKKNYVVKDKIVAVLLVMLFCLDVIAVTLVIYNNSSSASVADVSTNKTDDNNLRLISHRGYHENIPENTSSAFKASKEMGYNYVECDVTLTADGIPVILHDETINRMARNADGSTIDKNIKISDITYEQALEYSFDGGYSEYRGEKILTFTEFVELCKELDLQPYFDLKEDACFSREQLKELVDIVSEKGMLGKITWISFNLDYLKIILEYDKVSRYGYALSGDADIKEENIALIKDFVDAGVDVFIDAQYKKITPTVVTLCRKYGAGLEAGVIDTPSVVEQLPDYVTGVTTNTILPENFYGNS